MPQVDFRTGGNLWRCRRRAEICLLEFRQENRQGERAGGTAQVPSCGEVVRGESGESEGRRTWADGFGATHLESAAGAALHASPARICYQILPAGPSGASCGEVTSTSVCRYAATCAWKLRRSAALSSDGRSRNCHVFMEGRRGGKLITGWRAPTAGFRRRTRGRQARGSAGAMGLARTSGDSRDLGGRSRVPFWCTWLIGDPTVSLIVEGLLRRLAGRGGRRGR
ncbi:hypothetical protein CBR_g10937 [Chara braunii]|uniref:Uncharacterized protein n=1 Tax=Chara braunii TaxID=69332 RepID=A0A388KPM0_CHABU|nr:hypothetical protein CBR_g10937 [Chara braunii]|eukprot:GBG72001.1 hypothetical protein CBR_g10937 [Chara braunii]